MKEESRSAESDYKIRYAKAHYKRVPFDVPFDQYEEMKEHCTVRGESINGFLKRAAREQIDRDRNAENDG